MEQEEETWDTIVQFTRQLESMIVEDWRPYYVQYSRLKSLISELWPKKKKPKFTWLHRGATADGRDIEPRTFSLLADDQGSNYLSIQSCGDESGIFDHSMKHSPTKVLSWTPPDTHTLCVLLITANTIKSIVQMRPIASDISHEFGKAQKLLQEKMPHGMVHLYTYSILPLSSSWLPH